MDTSTEATAGRLRRYYGGESSLDIYGQKKSDEAAWWREMDERALARAWLAANPADDAEPAGFEWVAAQAKRCVDEGFWDIPPSGDVWWEIGPLSFTCESYQSDPGEPTETVAADWQVDGEPLPNLLWPRTRGDVRRLLAAFGITATEAAR